MLIDLADAGHTKIVDAVSGPDSDRHPRTVRSFVRGPSAPAAPGNYQPLRGICAAEFLLIGS
ncbi:hypothetical protein [Streptomyces sp. NPDC060366]|uniref:hypothetical protein n=1 Tax=Streptomyces sp. NPDC060366 TaxID=3347105 RepID=UPI003649AD6E